MSDFLFDNQSFNKKENLFDRKGTQLYHINKANHRIKIK